jgi:hypothetical protein
MMSELLTGAASAWRQIRDGKMPLPVAEKIPDKHCFPAGVAGYPVFRDKMYFSIRVNEMYLRENFKWLTAYDPLVVVVVEFNYGKTRVVIPRIIGPDLITRHIPSGQPQHGTVLENTLVTGPHPYRGGDVDISIGFYRIERINYGRSLLKLVENLSGLFGVAQLSMIVQTGKALLEGLQGVLGLEQTAYLAGHRISAAPSPLQPFSAGFSALIVPPTSQKPSDMLVRDGRLYVKNADGVEARYTESDFVLMSVTGSQERQDEKLFPFYELKVKALAALMDGDDGLKRAKANLIAAYQQMRESEDLTGVEVGTLFDSWLRDFELEEERITKIRALPYNASEPTLDPFVADLNNVVGRLAL